MAKRYRCDRRLLWEVAEGWVLAGGQAFSPLTPNPNPSPAGGRGAYPWRGHSDTETLLAGFVQWGVEETLRRAVGMFAIALWDRRDRVLTLARDRLGEKPLYYGWQGDTFLFGSELKALRAHPAFAAAIRSCLAKNY